MKLGNLNGGSSFSNPLRAKIDQVTSGKTSQYAGEVNFVNGLLDKFKVGISPQSAQGVISNVKKVEKGQMSEVSAHLRESLGFGRDAFVSASKGDLRQASVEALGSVLNAAGAAFKSTFTPTPSELKGNSPW
jgi:hypothetical protein